VDFSTRTELANDAHAQSPVEAIRRLINADTLRFISPKELVEAITGTPVAATHSQQEAFCKNGLCGHCFTGLQPVRVRESGLMRKKNRRT
jgi:glutamine phosphoribosylpyrophosphate amidotransferase